VIFDSNGKTRIDDDRLLKLLLRTILSDFTAKFPEAFLIVRDDIKPQFASCSKAPPGNQAWPEDSQANIRFVIDVFFPQADFPPVKQRLNAAGFL
jgi:hypothetical protein